MNVMLGILVFYPFVGGLLAYMLGRKKEDIRDYVANVVVVSEFILITAMLIQNWGTAGAEALTDLYIPEICGFGLTFTMDGFRLVYGWIASLMWMMTTILSREYFKHHENRNRFYLFLLMTFGATMGVFLSSDLFTTFIFFEIMSFTSYVWVAQEEDKLALRAADTYLAVAVIGGLVMLMGIFLLYHELGTVTMSELLQAAQEYQNKKVLYAAGICMLVGFGGKAGAFPLHIWLPKAHPVAPAPASALLSGILTKTGIFGILVISSNLFLHDAAWGTMILWVGVLTMFGGALLAVFSVDLKRTLACSSMSQIGFILVGVGMQGVLGEHGALAVHGTMLHMVNHSMIKLVLFMAAGVIFMNAHALELNQIRGFGRRKPLLKVIFLIGALAIGGIPMFSGYISKTLIHESIVEYGGGLSFQIAEFIFLSSGGLTLAYMTKLFVAIFIQSNTDKNLQQKYDQMKEYMSPQSIFALAGSALILLMWGFFPHQIMDKVAEMGQGLMHLEDVGHQVEYFSGVNLSGAVISIVIGAVVYFWIVRIVLMRKEDRRREYVNAWPKWFDLEEIIYRPILLKILPCISAIICRIFDSFVDLCVVFLRKTLYKDSPLPYERPEGNIFTVAGGRFLNVFQAFGNALWNHKNPKTKDYEHILAIRNEEFKETNKIIQRSLSFGLMLFGIGVVLTFIYLIWW